MVFKRNTIWFFYPISTILTGQEQASLLILDLVDNSKNFIFKRAKLFAFNREKKWLINYWFQYLYRQYDIWKKMWQIRPQNKSFVYFNLSQSLKGLILEGLPFYVNILGKNNVRVVVSLHGNFFMTWSPRSLKTKILKNILDSSFIISVLGLSPKNKLVKLGIEKKKIICVNNTCEKLFEDSFSLSTISDKINILFFSNIIESKGYKEFLEAILILSNVENIFRLNVVICGKVTKSSLGKKSRVDPNKWILNIINKINRSSKTHVEWIKGAYNEEKIELFRKTHIFLFPSKIEAQPIVILEAMASGCAIIASSAGEIPTMLSKGAGICLGNCTPEKLASTVLDLIVDREKLYILRREARERYMSNYSRKIYGEMWLSIFQKLTN